MIIILNIIVVILVMGFIPFSIFILVLLPYIFFKYSKELKVLGMDRIFCLNLWFFPVKTVRKIAEEREIKKLQLYVSIIRFLKFLSIIGFIIVTIWGNVRHRIN